MSWRENATEQNLRLTQKMLEQQGEISRLKAELAEALADNKKLHLGVANLADANTALTSEHAQALAAVTRLDNIVTELGHGWPQLIKKLATFPTAARRDEELRRIANMILAGDLANIAPGGVTA